MNRKIIEFINQWATNWHDLGTTKHDELCQDLEAMLGIMAHNEKLIQFTTQENDNER